MHIDRLVFVISGVLVLICIALGALWSTRWLLGAAIVGLNMAQAGFTGLCPIAWTLRKLGLESDRQTAQIRPADAVVRGVIATAGG